MTAVERSRHYVVVRGLSGNAPRIHALAIGGPPWDRIRTPCGLSWPWEHSAATLSLLRHVEHLPACGRCYP